MSGIPTNPYTSPASPEDSAQVAVDKQNAARSWNLLPMALGMFSLAVFIAALTSEAAYKTGKIGFNEPLTVQGFLDALLAISTKEIGRLEIGFLDWTAVLGMLLLCGMSFEKFRTIPLMPVVLYSGLLFVLGGWLGIIALAFLPFAFPLDGEFISDGFARILAIGVWMAVVVSMLVFRFRHMSNKTIASVQTKVH